MVLGSHNTMSYLPLRNWWLYPFRFMARCQSVDYRQQYNRYGVRLFDLRIGFFEGDCPMFCHGLANYKGDVNEVLAWVNSKGDCTVRIILEKGDEDVFMRWINHWKSTFRNISWVCGVRKKDWKDLCGMVSIESVTKHYYASMQGNKINDLYPKLWAKKYNHRYRMCVNDTDPYYVMFDFIEY